MACEGRSGCEATEATGVKVSGLEQLRGVCTERGPAGELLTSTALAPGNPGLLVTTATPGLLCLSPGWQLYTHSDR